MEGWMDGEVKNSIYVLGKAHMRSTLSLVGSFPLCCFPQKTTPTTTPNSSIVSLISCQYTIRQVSAGKNMTHKKRREKICVYHSIIIKRIVYIYNAPHEAMNANEKHIALKTTTIRAAYKTHTILRTLLHIDIKSGKGNSNQQDS